MRIFKSVLHVQATLFCYLISFKQRQDKKIQIQIQNACKFTPYTFLLPLNSY